VGAWVRGIAARVLANHHRKEALGRRCVNATTLGEERWAAVLECLCTASDEAAISDRLDIEQFLSRISAAERRIIRLHFYQGMDGEELASELGVPTAGAARARVYRALQGLRRGTADHFPPFEGEVLP
jgi:DNA-directed RNA polymerase specialized sigma24 family protein